MKKSDAKKLHNEDEVIVKKTGEVLRVVDSHLNSKRVYLLLSDGNYYNHKEIK